MKKTLGLSLAACLMVAGTPLLSAAGGGAGQGLGSAGTSAGGATAAAGGGGHAAAASTGGAHASTGAGMRGGLVSTTGLNGGNRSAGVGSTRPATSTYNAGPRYVSGGFAPNVANRSPVIGANPAAAQTFGGNTTTARTAPTFPAARAHNAWTDPAPTSAGRTPNGATGLNQRGGNDRRNPDNFTGTVLYPNAGGGLSGDRRLRGPGDLAGSINSGRYGSRYHRRGYYGPYGNGYGFGYPGVFIGGYDPYSYGGGAVGDYVGADTDGNFAGNNVPSPVAVDAISQPYPTGNAVMQPPADPADDDAPPSAPPAPNVQSNNGPDSLVEAVQAELSRRGYFGGKIDAIYNEATHAAIQRFQKDQKLPASGRINEATLHALQLD